MNGGWAGPVPMCDHPVTPPPPPKMWSSRGPTAPQRCCLARVTGSFVGGARHVCAPCAQHSMQTSNLHNPFAPSSRTAVGSPHPPPSPRDMSIGFTGGVWGNPTPGTTFDGPPPIGWRLLAVVGGCWWEVHNTMSAPRLYTGIALSGPLRVSAPPFGTVESWDLLWYVHNDAKSCGTRLPGTNGTEDGRNRGRIMSPRGVPDGH